MDYAGAIDWLYNRQQLGIKLGLDKVRRLLELVGNPHAGINVVHVAGTNGKGSVTHLLANALQSAGHKTGRYTSPHLSRFTERIVVNGEEISRERVVQWVESLQAPTQTLDDKDQAPTFFELVTAMALLEFQAQGVDWAVIETGLGGRLDATNVVEPALSLITNVGIDHAEFLGENLNEIAFEKAGIMKQGVPCVTGARSEALTILKAVSHERHVPMSVLDEDYHAVPALNGFRLVTPMGEAFYNLALAGEHQIDNAALAVMACDALRASGVALPPEAVHAALAQTQVPGRLESLAYSHENKATTVLLDGAHNVDGAVALRRHFANSNMGEFQLIAGFHEDKNWQDMLNQWAPLASRVHGVPIGNSRSLQPAAMRDLVEGIGIPFTEHTTVASALDAAMDAPNVVVAGSLFLVAAARALILGEEAESVRGNQ